MPEGASVLQCRIMNKFLLLGVLAAVCLTGCNKSKSGSSVSASARPDDAVQLKLKALAGSGATDCGRLDVRAADQQLTGASTCAQKAAESKHPFYVAYDMPGCRPASQAMPTENCSQWNYK